MQAVEIATTISSQGQIALPGSLRELYGRHARVILLIEDQPEPLPAATDSAQQRETLRKALGAVAAAGIFAQADADAWQQALRADRPLPGRED